MTIEAYLAHKTKRSRWGLGAKTGQLIYFYGTAHRPFVHVWHRRPVNTKWYDESGTTWNKMRITCKGPGLEASRSRITCQSPEQKRSRAGAWPPHGKEAWSRVRDATGEEKKGKEREKEKAGSLHDITPLPVPTVLRRKMAERDECPEQPKHQTPIRDQPDRGRGWHQSL